jgi:hypothetical protein
MSTIRSAMKGLLVAAALLAANATLAGDVTSDRQQLALQERTRGTDRKGQATPVESETMKSATAQLCACSTARDQHGASGHQH